MELNAITLVSIIEHMKKQRIICNCRLSRERACEINAAADIIANLLAASHKNLENTVFGITVPLVRHSGVGDEQRIYQAISNRMSCKG